MKKPLLVILSLLLVCTLVVGCAEQGNNTDETTAGITTDIPASTDAPASSEEPVSSEEPASSNEPESSVEPESSETEDPESEPYAHAYNITDKCEICGDIYVDIGLVFRKTEDSYSVTYYTGTAKIVEIPTKYKGLPVTSIGNSVFSGCSSLTSITFQGTVAEWNAITQGTGWSHNVLATEVVCSDGSVSLK